MDPVVHFEVPGEDMERMKKFYTAAFDWEMSQMGADMGDYVVVMTDKSDKSGPLEKGRINGGFYKQTADSLSKAPSFVVAVKDIRESMKKVEAAGGKIVGGSPEKPVEPVMIPGVGEFVSVIDTEGNRLSILQPSMDMTAGK